MLRLSLLALAAALLLGLKWMTARPPLSVKTVRVQSGTVRDVVTSSTAGEIVAAQHATVRAELGARVVAVPHRRGDRVRRGEAVVRVDAADLDARVAQAQASIDAQRAAVAQAEARAQAAARAAERARALADKGAGTAQLSDDSAATAREADAAAQAARSLLEQTRASLQVARVARSKADLSAPFDGLLVEVYPDAGEELSPGAPVFEIIDDTRLHAEATVDEADASRVRIAQPATLTLDALPGRAIGGHVSRIAPAVRKDPKGARTLPIEVEVDDVAAAVASGLKSGMSVNVEVVTAQKPGVISLPTNVIIGRGAKRTVYVVEDGRAHLRPVEVGLSNWDQSEITSGLAVGTEVIATLNAKGLEEGTKVKVGAVP